MKHQSVKTKEWTGWLEGHQSEASWSPENKCQWKDDGVIKMSSAEAPNTRLFLHRSAALDVRASSDEVLQPHHDDSWWRSCVFLLFRTDASLCCSTLPSTLQEFTSARWSPTDPPPRTADWKLAIGSWRWTGPVWLGQTTRGTDVRSDWWCWWVE